MRRAVIAGTLVFVVPPGALLELCRSRSALSQIRWFPTGSGEESKDGTVMRQNRATNSIGLLYVRKHDRKRFVGCS
jgi:hypothetical protein